MNPHPHTDLDRCTVTLCRGCCCGTLRKHPTLDHADQLKLLHDTLHDNARLRTSTCLGPCQHSNVTVITPSHHGHRRGGRPVWLGWVLDDNTIHAIADWARSGGPGIHPLPDTLSLHEFPAPGPRPRTARRTRG